MFLESILFDNLLQMSIQSVGNLSNLATYQLSAIFEYLFRNLFIGLFLPFYSILEYQQITGIKFITWLFVNISGRNNYIDVLFRNYFGFFPYQFIFTFWIFMFIICKVYINFIQQNVLDEPYDENYIESESESEYSSSENDETNKTENNIPEPNFSDEESDGNSNEEPNEISADFNKKNL